MERGELEAARAALGRYQGPMDESDAANFLRWSTIEVLLGEGKAEEALKVAEEYEQTAARYSNPGWSAWRALKAQALDRLGRTDEAVALAEEELELSRALGRAGHGRPHAASRSAQVKREEGVPHLSEAVAAARELVRPARAREGARGPGRRHSGAGASRRRPASRCAARSSWRTPAAPARWPSSVRSELYATGARPRTTRPERRRRRSRPASGAWPGWPPRARPTATSPSRCS